MSNIAVKQIELNRWEGGVGQAGDITNTASSYQAADAVLSRWAMTAPKDGGYDKVGFKITFVDGETYEGRYDLSYNRTDQDSATLAEHVRRFARFYSGRLTAEELSTFKSGITPDDYRVMLNRVSEETQQGYRTLLDNYDLGGTL